MAGATQLSEGVLLPLLASRATELLLFLADSEVSGTAATGVSVAEPSLSDCCVPEGEVMSLREDCAVLEADG